MARAKTIFRLKTAPRLFIGEMLKLTHKNVETLLRRIEQVLVEVKNDLEYYSMLKFFNIETIYYIILSVCKADTYGNFLREVEG